MQVGEFDAGSLPDVTEARSEADLGGECTHYLISSGHARYRSAPTSSIRKLLANTAFAACGNHPRGDTTRLVLRPVLTACLKTCFGVEGGKQRARLAFDVDGGEGALLPAPALLHDVFVEWLATVWSDVDWAAESCVIFGGSFPDKSASLHVYFCNRCLFPAANNKYAVHAELFAALDSALAQWGALTIDRTISGSGLKYPFCDKWLKTGAWRGKAQQLLATYNVEIDTWLELFTHCDPLVYDFDDAWHNALDFPRPRKQAVRAAAAPAAPALAAPVDETIAKIIARVAPWKDASFKRRNGTAHDGVELLLPDSTFCPVYDNHHSTRGSSFAVVTATGSIKLKCHKAKCAGDSITIAGPHIDDSERHIIHQFNSEYAKLGGKVVIAVPQLLNTGKLSPIRWLTQADFCAETRQLGEKIHKMYYPNYWLLHPLARQYKFGVVCDPSGTADPRFFNTYQGIAQDVYKASLTMTKLSDDELLARFPVWYSVLKTNMCADEQPLIDYSLNMMAHAMQLPHIKPGVALVFTGPPGCGKGLVTRALVNIYGDPHGKQVCASDLNSAFNEFASDAVVLLIDEAEQGSGKFLDNALLKMRITETKAVINAKFQPQRMAPQFDHVFINSNGTHNDKIVVEYQPGERRFVGIPADHRLAEPQSPDHVAMGTNLSAEINDTATLAALYTWLLRRDISKFSPTVMPVSSATWRLQYASMSPCDRFVYRLLCSGNVCVRSYEPDAKLQRHCEGLMSVFVENGGTGVDVSQLGYNVFSRPRLRYPSDIIIAGFAQHYPRDTKTTDSQLWQALKRLSDEWDKGQVSVNGERVVSFLFPYQSDLRTAFLRLRGNLDARIWNEWKME